MLPKLTFDYATQTYHVPAEWVSWDWINDFENYPDQNHEVFKDEYDWSYRNKSGVLNRYIRTIEGHTTICTSKKSVQYERHTAAKPYVYYFFALAAVELINTPSLYRSERASALNGAFVVNYANSIDISNLTIMADKTRNKKYIISSEFGALLARVFNATSGVRRDDFLKVEQREDKKSICPNCKTVYELLSKNCWTPEHPEYQKYAESFIAQLEYIRSRNTNG
jgi:hypothetical protein